LVLGILKLLFYGITILFFNSFFPFLQELVGQEEGEEAVFVLKMVSTAGSAILILAILFTAIPSIVGGIAGLKNRGWGLVLMLISGCLSLLNFPIGTGLGVYSIWVFVEAQKERKTETA
jgi:hypothetical protein